MLWRSFLNKQFRALDGRRFGLFTGFVQAGDAFLGGDGFHGVLESVSDGLTATPGGGQANALRLVSVKNRLTAVATGGDSVMLPASNAGMHILVVNDGAASAQAFGEINTLDTIDGVATGTGIVLPSGSRVYFECTTTGVAGTPGAWSSNAAVAAGTGNVTGTGPTTIGHLAVFNTTDGKGIQDGGAPGGSVITKITGVFTANGTLGTVPADAMIIAVTLLETAGHTVSVSLGTSAGGAQVLTAFSVTANSIVAVPASSLLLAAWIANQSIFVASSSWNSASITATLWYLS